MKILIFLLFPLVGACQWSGLASNQTVSLNNLQNAVSTGVFTAKTTIPSGTKSITKTEANTYVNINTSNAGYASKASNQLMVKTDLTAPSSGVVYTATSGLYPLSGNTFTSSSGTIINYTGSTVYLFVVFNSAGLNSGSVSGDNMVIVPQPAVTISGTISSYGQLIFGTQYFLSPGVTYNITITKGDLLGGGSTVRFYYSTTPSTITAIPI